MHPYVGSKAIDVSFRIRRCRPTFGNVKGYGEYVLKAALCNPPANLLLAALPRAEYSALEDHLVRVEVRVGEVLQHAREPVHDVWFPTDSLVSLRAETETGAMLEVGLAGRNEFVGARYAQGTAISLLAAVVQQPGAAMRLSISHLEQRLRHSPRLQLLIAEAMQGLMMQASQNALCSHYHLLEERLARSLLQIRDRVQRDEFHLTHEFLSQALGVRRVGVTKAAMALQTRNLIHYTRGAITIIDAAALQSAACGCYQLDRRLQMATESRLKK